MKYHLDQLHSRSLQSQVHVSEVVIVQNHPVRHSSKISALMACFKLPMHTGFCCSIEGRDGLARGSCRYFCQVSIPLTHIRVIQMIVQGTALGGVATVLQAIYKVSCILESLMHLLSKMRMCSFTRLYSHKALKVRN